MKAVDSVHRAEKEQHGLPILCKGNIFILRFKVGNADYAEIDMIDELSR